MKKVNQQKFFLYLSFEISSCESDAGVSVLETKPTAEEMEQLAEAKAWEDVPSRILNGFDKPEAATVNMEADRFRSVYFALIEGVLHGRGDVY